MKRFNFEELFNTYHRKYKIYLWIFIASLLVLIATFLIGLFSSTYENKNTIMIVFSIILSFIVIANLIIFIFGVNHFYINKKQLHYILGSYMDKVSGQISEIKQVITSISGRKGLEIILINGDKKMSILYDVAFGECPFKIGDHLNCKISESFIIQYEVVNG